MDIVVVWGGMGWDGGFGFGEVVRVLVRVLVGMRMLEFLWIEFGVERIYRIVKSQGFLGFGLFGTIELVFVMLEKKTKVQWRVCDKASVNEQTSDRKNKAAHGEGQGGESHSSNITLFAAESTIGWL